MGMRDQLITVLLAWTVIAASFVLFIALVDKDPYRTSSDLGAVAVVALGWLVVPPLVTGVRHSLRTTRRDNTVTEFR